MPTDQTIFYRTIREMIDLTNNPLLLDQSPSERIHNRRAAILRHGLRVCAFSSLEAYFRDRLTDVCSHLSTVGYHFASYSPELQNFLIVDGVIGLANSTGFLPKLDRLAFVDQNLRDLSTFDATSPIFTTFGFSPRGSNVAEHDISEALKAFHVARPWVYMTGKSSLVGGGSTSLKVVFEKLAKDRNKSAHNPNGQIPTADLEEHLRSVLTIGVAFDAALGKIFRAFQGAIDFPAFKHNIASCEPKMRFVDERIDGKWDERSNVAGRSLKVHADEQAAITAARQRLDVDMVVIRDRQKRPIAAKN